MLIADKIAGLMDDLKNQLSKAIEDTIAFVEYLEKDVFDPRLCAKDIMDQFHTKTKEVWRLIQHLNKFGIFDEQLNGELAVAGNFADDIGERFIQFTKRLIINVKDAALLYERSRSTIYRWIKNGKLAAQKQNRRWSIAI